MDLALLHAVEWEVVGNRYIHPRAVNGRPFNQQTFDDVQWALVEFLTQNAGMSTERAHEGISNQGKTHTPADLWLKGHVREAVENQLVGFKIGQAA